eukprot:jgi/Tetstr1/456691/TSEL_043392.t1
MVSGNEAYLRRKLLGEGDSIGQWEMDVRAQQAAFRRAHCFQNPPPAAQPLSDVRTFVIPVCFSVHLTALVMDAAETEPLVFDSMGHEPKKQHTRIMSMFRARGEYCVCNHPSCRKPVTKNAHGMDTLARDPDHYRKVVDILVFNDPTYRDKVLKNPRSYKAAREKEVLMEQLEHVQAQLGAAQHTCGNVIANLAKELERKNAEMDGMLNGLKFYEWVNCEGVADRLRYWNGKPSMQRMEAEANGTAQRESVGKPEQRTFTTHNALLVTLVKLRTGLGTRVISAWSGIKMSCLTRISPTWISYFDQFFKAEFPVPSTADMLDRVHPEWREAFSIRWLAGAENLKKTDL